MILRGRAFIRTSVGEEIEIEGELLKPDKSTFCVDFRGGIAMGVDQVKSRIQVACALH